MRHATLTDREPPGPGVDTSRRGGAPVVLVHGSRTSRTMWRAQLAALRATGVPACAVDLPAHGTRADEPFTLDASLTAVHDAVRAVSAQASPDWADAGRAVVVGLSLGGYVAIEHRARFPEQSAGLVAAGCCTPTSSVLRPAWFEVARWIESWPDHGAGLNAAMVRALLTPEGERDLGAGGYALTAMSQVLREVAQVDALGALACAQSPVWLVNGKYDHFRTAQRAFLSAARSSGARARLVTVRGARHLVSLDAPVAFNRVLLEAASHPAVLRRADG